MKSFEQIAYLATTANSEFEIKPYEWFILVCFKRPTRK